MNELLQKEIQKWVGDDIVVAEKTIEKKQHTLVITHDGEPKGYSVIRAFMMGDVPGVSVDVSKKGIQIILEYLLNQI